MKLRPFITALAVTALVGGGAVVAGCGSDNNNDSGSTSGSSGGKGGKIALLLPESKTARYESQDHPKFEAKVKELCSDCEIVYSNADQDASKQQSQADAALTQGVKVMVLDPVDAASAAAIVTRAKQKNVPVISYDRLIPDAPIDYYISYDNEGVGKLQADSLSKKLAADGNKNATITMINGAPTDNNAKLFKQGATAGFKAAGIKIGKSYDTPDWSPDKAQQEMEQAITAIGKDNVVGVLSANDGMAGGAIAAMKRAGYKDLPPITGQDAELGAVQRILTGEQYMTIYLDIRAEAEKSAELAVSLVKGEQPAATSKVNNGTADIPAVLLDPIAVTADKVKDTIVKDGFYKADQICTAEVKDACAKAGIE
ncbi:MAG: D-xylose transport system substrate-binding protein [Solirubrobacterales bacterium]|nr:D-xylose transport system substrate-binding protein [Solirubrobacterales bacterium]